MAKRKSKTKRTGGVSLPATARKRKTAGKMGVRHVVVVSDLHVGCQMAIVHPDGARQAEGGWYTPSKFQRMLYGLWEQFWEVEVPIMTQGEPFDIVINGECVDGSHHNAVNQWTQNLTDQCAASIKLIEPLLDKCKRLFIIRGTEAHSGKSGQQDEQIAREVGAVPCPITGQYSRYELFYGLRDGIIHFTHTVGCVGSQANEASAPLKDLTEFYLESGRWGERPPDAIVRSHRHRHVVVELATCRGKALACVTPAWQGKTPFAYKIAGGRPAQPQFGGICLSWSEKERFIYELHRVWRPDRPEAE